MEKKGEILNQLAIISDLLENVNAEVLFTEVVFNLKEDEFQNVYKRISQRGFPYGTDLDKTFAVKIGEIQFIFNKSNV